MYCESCGAPLPDDVRFCDHCGSEVAPTDRDAGSASAPARRVGKSKGMVIAITVSIAVVMLVAGGLAWAVASGAFFSDTKSLSIGDAEPGAAQPEDQPVADEQGGFVPSVVRLDIADSDDYRSVNTYLSNFSETGFAQRYSKANPYDCEKPDENALLSFAIYHNAYNTPNAWEGANDIVGSTWYPIVDAQGDHDAVSEGYNERISADVIESTVERYVKVDFDATRFSDDYHYEDGYVYFRVTNGSGIPEGIVLSRVLTDLGSNRYRVEFDIYGGPDTYYDTTDASLYGLSASDLATHLGVDGPNLSGVAVIEAGFDGPTPFKLVSCYVDPAPTHGAASTAETREYTNARFGFCSSIPSSFAQVQEPANGDGAVFEDGTTGMRATFWGSNNVDGSTAQSEFESLTSGHHVAYSCVEDDFCVVSYEEGGSIVYIKEFVGSGSSCAVRFEYPASSAKDCDAIVAQTEASFEPGDLSTSH